MNETLLAYLAGAMDSDGFFSIKCSTYHRRVRLDAVNNMYFERMGLRQVTPSIPDLLHQIFAGARGMSKGQTSNSKPLHHWHCTNRLAAKACTLLLPYLLVKKPQALVLLELRKSHMPQYGQLSYWFSQEHPGWREMEMITTSDAMKILRYGNKGSIAQCLRNKTLLGLPYNHRGEEVPRFPKLLVEQLASLRTKNGQGQLQPPQLVAWRQRLYEKVRTLNTVGLHGTPINHCTRFSCPKGVAARSQCSGHSGLLRAWPVHLPVCRGAGAKPACSCGLSPCMDGIVLHDHALF